MVKLFWKSVVPLFLVLVVDAISFGIVIPILGPMLLEPSSPFLPSSTPLDMRTLYYSLCLGLPMAFMFVGAPLLGDISDQIGRKKALIVAMLGIALSCFISGIGVVGGSIFLLLAGRCLLGFMDSSESVAKAAIADISVTPKQKVLNLSLASVAGTGGFVLGPMIGGLLSTSSVANWFGYNTPFVIAGALAVFNAIILFFFFTETYHPQKKVKIHILNSFKNLTAAFSNPHVRLLSLIFFCMQYTWGTFFQSVSILLVRGFHFNTEKIGFFLSFLSCFFVITLSVIIRILLKFFEQNTIIVISMVLVMLGSIIISIAHQELAAWLSVIPMSIGLGLGYNTMLSLFSDAVDKDSQGRIMGAAVGIFSIAWVVSSIVGGLLSSQNLYLPYMVASVIAFVGLIAAFFIGKKHA